MIGLDDELDVRDEGRGRVREGTGLTAGCFWCQGAALWGEGEPDWRLPRGLLVSWLYEPGGQEGGGSHYGNKCSLK